MNKEKVNKLFTEYRKTIRQRWLDAAIARKQILKGNRTKLRILAFYERNGRWPNRQNGLTENERNLGTRFENFISKKAGAYDPDLRKISIALGRKASGKKEHNVVKFKNDILNFLAEHGRVPSTSYEHETIDGEANLRRKLDYYTVNCKDMTLLGQVYSVDKCHKSGIPAKYRKIINESIDVEKPLVRLTQKALNGDT